MKPSIMGPVIWIIIGALLVVAAILLPFGGNVDSQEEALPDPDPSPSETATPEPDICDPLFQQVEVSNEMNRADAHFSDVVDEALERPGSLNDNSRDALLERSAQNGFLLSQWTSAFGLHEDPNNWEGLVEDDCLSEEGQRLHAQFEGALKMNGTTIEIGEAPSDGTNSGVEDGIYGVADQPGISGDRTAIQITLPDGTVVWIMVRCGNVVYPGEPPGNLPKVATDDVGANPDVDDFYQDGQSSSEHHTISNGDGASVANGNQGTEADVEADRKAAEAKAAEEAAKKEADRKAAEAEAEESGGGIVNDTDDKTVAEKPVPGW